MADLSTVRTEIKTWERTFKSINRRDPSIQDIREQPAIEEKYRLYKKLSKAAAAGASIFPNHAKSSGPPSTPPRSKPHDARPSLLLSKPRAIEKTAPLSTFNPFSPQKIKGKQKESAVVNKDSSSNPFATPTKAKAKPRVQNREPSPEPFPPIQLSQASSSNFAPAPPPPAQTSAISRARKRLRGEPVSPSPNKDKRRRVDPQITNAFSMPYDHQPSCEEDEDPEAGNSSFVDDSPVKAPAGGKSFKLLFEETVAPQNVVSGKTKGTLARSKTIPASVKLFGERSDGVSANLGDDMDWDLGIKSGTKDNKDKKSVNGKSFTLPNRIVPGKGDLFSGGGPSNHVQPPTISNPSKAGPSKTNSFDTRTSTKRSLSDTEMEPGDLLTESTNPIPLLLPPSPPPADSSSYRASTKYNAKGKGKAKAKTRGHKKAKVVNEDEDEDEGANVDEDEDTGDIGHNVKLVDRTRFQGAAGEEAPDLDLYSILGYARSGFGVPHGNRSPTLHAGPVTRDVIGSRTEKFEVDLPDKLRHVLALSPSESKARDSKEERVFRGLLYGRRASHYDPVKGGEIWDVGEEEGRRNGDGEAEGGATTEGEDDWEGEPVPWEVGEL